nr:nuclear hormone receptor family member daf-12-like isoform X2 [Lepeophtheirus salmonis]
MLTRKQSNQLPWAHLQSEEISKSVDDVSKTIDLSEKHEILPNYPSAKTHYNNLDLLPDNPAPKRKRPKFIRRVKCQVCYDLANDHIHYGAISCYSCRAFFRRAVNSNADYFCSQNKNCVVTKHTRKHCQYCRFVKCLSVGMKSSWVMTEEDKKEKKEKAFIKKVKLKTCQLHRVSTKSKKSRQSFNKHTNSIKKEDNNGTTSPLSLRVPTLSEHIIPPRLDPSCLSSSLLSSHENPAQQSFTFSSASSPYSSMNRSLSCSPITMSNNTDALLSTHHSPREHSEFPGSPIVGTLSYDQSMNSSPIYTYLNTISSSSLQNHLYNNGRSNELSPPSKQSHISNTYALNPETSMSNQSYYNFNSTLRQKDPLEPPSISQSNYSPKNNHGELFSYSPLSGKSSPQLAKTEKIPPSLCKKFMDNETLPELLVNSNFPIDLSQKYTSVVDSCNYKIHPSEILTNLSTV